MSESFNLSNVYKSSNNFKFVGLSGLTYKFLCYLYLLNILSHSNSAGITEGFSMCAGDFVEVYNDESQEGKVGFYP